jgi:hypothetical protein
MLRGLLARQKIKARESRAATTQSTQGRSWSLETRTYGFGGTETSGGPGSVVMQPGSIGLVDWLGSQRGDIMPGIANLKVAILATDGFEQVEITRTDEGT